MNRQNERKGDIQMTIEITVVSRQRDGLKLCEEWNNGIIEKPKLMSLKKQAEVILKRHATNISQLHTIQAEGYNFYLLPGDLVSCLAICDSKTTDNVAFAYLTEVLTAFDEEVKRTYGTYGRDYSSAIEALEKPYTFLNFEKTIKRKRAEYSDPRGQKSMSKINDSLHEVSNIMRQNIEDLLKRGENLEHATVRASRLKEDSAKLKMRSRGLNLQAFLQTWLPIILLALFVIGALLYKIAS